MELAKIRHMQKSILPFLEKSIRIRDGVIFAENIITKN